MNDIKIILWCNDSPNQRALANKISTNNSLLGIVIESRTKKKKYNFTFLMTLIEKIYFRSIDWAWHSMLNKYTEKYPEWPKVDTLWVTNINDKKTKEFTVNLKSDLICISGTGLIKRELLDLENKFGIINLHTGLSPYIKGGPNCTNWCLSNNEPHFIGNTIMWLDEGIDSGNILTTERVGIDGHEGLNEIHEKVMENAHHLYLKAINKINTDVHNCPNITQKGIGKGRTFYTKMWGWKEKKRLLKNLKLKKTAKFINSANYADIEAKVITINI